MKAEKTIEVIASSFYQLTKKYSFSEITVNMICHEAGISRSTFYRFFKDKQDVVITFFCLRYDLIGHKYTDAKEYKQLICEYAKLIYDYKDFISKALKDSGQNSLHDHIYTSAFDYYVDHIEKASGKKISKSLLFKVVLFTSGIVSLYAYWLQHDSAISPEQLAEIALESMPTEMAQYFQ